MIKAKAFRTFIRIYSLFKSERLSTNDKLALHKALIRSIMTYACPAYIDRFYNCRNGGHMFSIGLDSLDRLDHLLATGIAEIGTCVVICAYHYCRLYSAAELEPVTIHLSYCHMYQ
jgi:hypothetical protein